MCYADPTKANNELGWKAEFGIERMCQDSWRWQSNNPSGYEEEREGATKVLKAAAMTYVAAALASVITLLRLIGGSRN